MSSDTIIRVENLSKRYLITHQGVGRGDGLRHVLQERLAAPWREIRARLSGNAQAEKASARSFREEYWALHDVSFEVKRGEVVGIIGRNGAGKSTLLKILSRITEPTRGRIELDGRVASLLEVGTGFHPELTGRENIFLNGAVLGMTRAEVRRKFDEIVAFAEVEKFLDTPVKRYSSGMYVRLAFAVAAHLEPEILVVDEVLAVGDAAFQRKCLGKMQSVAKADGRTVLFVSHNIASLSAICQTAITMDSGEVRFRGEIRAGIDRYVGGLSPRCSRIEYEVDPAKELAFEAVEIVDSQGCAQKLFTIEQAITIRIRYSIPKPLARAQIVCHLWNLHRVHVFATADIDDRPELLEGRLPGLYVAEINLPPSLLGPGLYQVSVACGVPNLHLIDHREGPSFEVSMVHSRAATWSGARTDVILALPLCWTTSTI